MSLSTFLVEDNPVIRAHLVSAMEDLLGAEIVAQVETEADAIDWMQAHPRSWTLAVVDLFLREGSGLGVVWACRNHSAAQKVVVLTNYATADARQRCMAAGADAVFDKSTELDAFLVYCERVERG